MIVFSKEALDVWVTTMIEINKVIVGSQHHIIKPNQISSPFASSPYIDDIRLDIATIGYNICNDHLFQDGNKRTAFAMIVELAHAYEIPFKVSDDAFTPIMLACASGQLNAKQLANKIFR